MIFREIIAVYCENRTEHINTPCGQNAVFSNLEDGGTYNYHCFILQEVRRLSVLEKYDVTGGRSKLHNGDL
jgi:hypothetical protein